MVEKLDKALAKTYSELGCEVIDYTVAPIFMKEQEKGAHRWIVEFKNITIEYRKVLYFTR
ncbi:MAG: GH3 auxin-responsive promoter family protein [Flavobacterium haoranii]